MTTPPTDHPSAADVVRLGLYGGTFDPIHHGHLILARDAFEQLGLDRVIFIPAALSPHKLSSSPATPELRRDMVAAAIQGEPRFALDDSEIDRAGPSYTIDTVEQIRREYPDAELFYFIGDDNLPALHTWRRIADLRQLVQFVVLGREGHAGPEEFPRIARRIDISSTEIRRRVACGDSIRYLVPEAVLSLIERNHLYRNPPHQS